MLNRRLLRANVLLLALLCSGCGDDTPIAPSEADAGGNGSSSDYSPPPELAALVDQQALLDRSTLDIVVDETRSGLVPGDFDNPVWRIGVSFFAHRTLANDWSHDAVLVLPETLPAGVTTAAIVQGWTENEVSGVSDSVNFLPQYAAVTAERLNMPVLLLDEVPPPLDLTLDATLTEYQPVLTECFSGPVAEPMLFESCLRELSQRSERPEIYPELLLAISYIRAVTLLEELAEQLPTFTLDFQVPRFDVEQVAVLASGVPGISLRYAMALDSRIVGVMAASADIGDFRGFHAEQQTAWQNDYAFGEPTTELSFWGSAASADFIGAFEISSWSSYLADRSYVMAVGTNDPFFPLGTFETYQAVIPTDHNILYVANYEEGMGSSDHLNAWRGFLAHLFHARPWTDISTAFEDDGGNIEVTATVSGSTVIQTVELWYVQRHELLDDTDFRDAVWQSTAMQNQGVGTYTAGFANALDNAAFFVRVFDSQGIYEGSQTSSMTQLP